MHNLKRIATGVFAMVGVVTLSHADELTLEKAIELAKKNNGVLASALIDVSISRSSVAQANSAFLPTLFPSYELSDRESKSSTNGSIFRSTDHTAGFDASWMILDAGQREYLYSQAKKRYEASKYSSLWTVRQVLFTVTQQFYEVLRAQALLKNAQAEVKRTKEIVDVVKKRIELGDAAKKDILQAEADLANAEVANLTAANQVETSEAGLRAIIGWPADEPLPDLAQAEPGRAPAVETLAAAVETGLARRPDLISAQRSLEATRYGVLSAERDAGLDWSLRVDYNRTVQPRDTFNRTLTFLVSYPVFDGGLSRERVRQAKLGLDGDKALYQQQLRDARSEIEAAYLVWRQDRLRLEASEKALKAAQINYDAVSESHRLGAASIQEVTTAQSTLVVAETNFIQARYDQYTSEVRLRLVIGEELPGEK